LHAALSAEAAGSLIHTARRVRDALDALRTFDAEVSAETRLPDDRKRSYLIDTAADLFLGYIVQREAIGLNDAEYMRREYQVPQEVWLRLGATRGR
jgi:hypothetical protein